MTLAVSCRSSACRASRSPDCRFRSSAQDFGTVTSYGSLWASWASGFADFLGNLVLFFSFLSPCLSMHFLLPNLSKLGLQNCLAGKPVLSASGLLIPLHLHSIFKVQDFIGICLRNLPIILFDLIN